MSRTDAQGQACQANGLRETARHWFPLIPRAKPPCPPLRDRVARVRQLAREAQQGTGESLSRAAQAHNLAALILSDSGMPAQARDLCRRQALLFAEAGPLDLPAAKLALQPAINIGRLSARNGDGDAACQNFQTLFEAAQSHADTTIDGLPVRFCTLTRNSGDHHEITQWLWTILLSDGARALASAGRWQDAARMAEQNNGIGQRLLDGRQILILAHCHRSDYEAAFSTLTSAITPTAWEQAVAACLEGTCRTWRGEPAANGHTAGVISSYLSAGHTPEPVTFRVRLGLCAIDITSPVPADSAGLARLTAREALDNGDAYAAYDVITHPGCLTYTEPGIEQALHEIVQVAALRQGPLPADVLEILMTSVQDTEAAITTMLRR